MSQNKTDKKTQENESYSLKGTFISVMLVGAFIIVSWAGVYGLFISR